MTLAGQLPGGRNSATASALAPTEAELLRRLRAGEESAYEELVRAAGDRMLAVARRMLRREEDAQDAVQDAFLSAFKSLNTFDGRSQLATWLHRITVNACLMKLRATRRRPELSIDTLLPQFVEDGHQRSPAGPWRTDPASRPPDQELRSIVRAKIEELPAPFREVMLLRDILDIDTEQTAAILGLNPGAVKTRLHRARQALRTMLNPYMAETPTP